MVVLVGWTAGLTARPSDAQQRERLAKADAPLVVDGVVQQVFRSPRQGRIDYLLAIDVLRAEGRKLPAGGAQPRFPGPGESVYVHISQRLDQAGRLVAGETYKELPEERSQIRAYLTPRQQGGWEGAFPVNLHGTFRLQTWHLRSLSDRRMPALRAGLPSQARDGTRPQSH